MIRNLVFDMGNVLIAYDPGLFIRQRGFEGEDADLLLKNVFLSEEWKHIDDGSMTEDEMIAALREKLPPRLMPAARDLILHWEEPHREIPGMYELIRDLRERGFRIFLLSNTAPRQRAYWPTLSFSVFFEGTLISAEEHQTKPGVEIFRTFLDRFGLDPAECLFIDDSEANVKAAESVDMQAIVFRGAENLKEELEKAL